MLKHLPNALTLLRLILAPFVAWTIWMAGNVPPGDDMAAQRQQIATLITTGSILFIAAALTDLFDGMAARAFNAHSKFGRIIDPIADKALVGLPLIVMSVSAWRQHDPAWPVIALATAVIVARDMLMTVLRLAAPDGEGAKVSQLAKIKTALELFVVGSFLVFGSIVSLMRVSVWSKEPEFLSHLSAFVVVWLGLLVIAATLSAITAIQYLRAKPARSSEATPET